MNNNTITNCCCGYCGHYHTAPVGEGYSCPKCGGGLWNEPMSEGFDPSTPFCSECDYWHYPNQPHMVGHKKVKESL